MKKKKKNEVKRKKVLSLGSKHSEEKYVKGRVVSSRAEGVTSELRLLE